MQSQSITRIDVFKLNIRLKKPFHFALGVIEHAENIMIRIHAGNGLYGLGEASPVSHLTGETQATDFETAKALGRLLIGKNPLEIWERMNQLGSTLVHNNTIKSAFDVALHDLAAKTLGLPLYLFLGGHKREIYTDATISIDSPEAMAQAALRLVHEGFPAIKVKLGTTRAQDVARIRAIRGVIGRDTPVRIDANQGWDPVTASLILRDLASFNIEYCEQPIAHWNTLALQRIRGVSSIPIMADESLFDHHDAFKLACAGACDYFNIKIAKSGGILNALKINAIAEGAGIRCMVGCMFETRLALSAAAHIVSARPNIIFADLDSPSDFSIDPVLGGIHYDGARITLPDAPGHGADMSPEFLAGLESVSIE